MTESTALSGVWRSSHLNHGWIKSELGEGQLKSTTHQTGKGRGNSPALPPWHNSSPELLQSLEQRSEEEAPSLAFFFFPRCSRISLLLCGHSSRRSRALQGCCSSTRNKKSKGQEAQRSPHPLSLPQLWVPVPAPTRTHGAAQGERVAVSTQRVTESFPFPPVQEYLWQPAPTHPEPLRQPQLPHET